MIAYWADVIRKCCTTTTDQSRHTLVRPVSSIEERFRQERQSRNQAHYVTFDYRQLLEIAKGLRECATYLVSVIANDERYMEDGCFKIYYVFSAKEKDAFLILEYLLLYPRDPYFPSLQTTFKAVRPFEREIADLYGLIPFDPNKLASIATEASPVDAVQPAIEAILAALCTDRAHTGDVLHDCYPPDFAPLRADGRSLGDLIELADKHLETRGGKGTEASQQHLPASGNEIDHDASETPSRYSDGQLVMPVGPIHKDIIEAGRFDLRIAGEPIENLDVALGYKHKGIERLFTAMSLMDGWKLAERVSGDSSFAHSMAYCHAVEELAGVNVGLRTLAQRALFLELERIYNHVADTAALAHDAAFNVISSEITVLREWLMRLNSGLLSGDRKQHPGARLLRGINVPGGMQIEMQLNSQFFTQMVRQATGERFASLSDLLEEFDGLGQLLLQSRAFIDRAQYVGLLKGPQALSSSDVRNDRRFDARDDAMDSEQDEATSIGATGLVARASGIKRDFRLQHPFGIYQWAQENLEQAKRLNLAKILERSFDLPSPRLRYQPLVTEEKSGDVYSRTRIRIDEVAQSGDLIGELLHLLDECATDRISVEPEVPRQLIETRIHDLDPYEFALGYVEGWRGDIVYWLMNDRFSRIFRCKVRDPSTLNWQALKAAVADTETRKLAQRKRRPIVPDFPLINKSFGLSISGNDL